MGLWDYGGRHVIAGSMNAGSSQEHDPLKPIVIADHLYI